MAKATAMITLTIEKGIPIPARTTRGPTRCRYPFADMEIGDSVFVPETLHNNPRGSLLKQRPKKFVMRQQIVGDVIGLRIWRIE